MSHVAEGAELEKLNADVVDAIGRHYRRKFIFIKQTAGALVAYDDLEEAWKFNEADLELMTTDDPELAKHDAGVARIYRQTGQLNEMDAVVEHLLQRIVGIARALAEQAAAEAVQVPVGLVLH